MNNFILQAQSWGLEPNDRNGEDCVHLYDKRRYYLNDNDCSTRYSPLCEAPLEAICRT